MAEPHQVEHGNLHHKIVRVYPERYRPGHELDRINEMLAGRGKAPITAEQAVADTVKHAAERGFRSGDLAKVVMVSTWGDCGVTKHLRAEYGYAGPGGGRFYPECLVVVPDEELPSLLAEFDRGRVNGAQGPKKKLTLAEKRRRRS